MNNNESEYDFSLAENSRELDKDFPVMVTPDDFGSMLYRPEPKTIKRILFPKNSKKKKNFWDL